VNPTSLIRTLDQEVLGLLRGASLECLVCGEFVQHRLGVIACPECGAAIQAYKGGKRPELQSKVQAG
jgi:Zn finger protein HypA/HybF involved in hydrogenase expression